jgi:hypothetical protein
MNMGMQDAYNLGWKLALRHRGLGTEALLESYSAERHPVVAATLDWTDRATKGALVNLGLENHLVIEARNRLMSFLTGFGMVQQKASRVLSMLEVAYDESPICSEHRAGLMSANVTTETSSESPSVRSWYAFGSGPRPGERAPDAWVDPADPSGSLRVHALFRGTQHTLLLFDGAAATSEGYANLSQIATSVMERLGDGVKVHIIVPSDTRPAALDPQGSVVLDPAGNLHACYEARTECLYLVRPDGYVGFRSQPANLDALMKHLDLTFP